jgi:uncharacterized membrane protein
LPKHDDIVVQVSPEALKAAALGVISGLRSMSGPASVARAARDGRLSLEGTGLSFLGSPRVATVLTVLQAGELIGDKLPATPSRTSPPPLLGRAGAGALVGAAVSEGKRPVAGALLGAGVAVAAAFAGENVRAMIGERSGVPDVLLALAEDAVVMTLGARLLRQG